MLDNRVIVCVLLKDSLIVFCGEWSADPLTSSPRRNAADMCLFKPPVSLVGGGFCCVRVANGSNFNREASFCLFFFFKLLSGFDRLYLS